jgi:hypothetical protein
MSWGLFDKAKELVGFAKADADALETVVETERELSALMSHCDVVAVDRDGFSKQSYVDGPKYAEAYAAEHLADHDQSAWKRHPNPAMRRANVLAKRQREAAFAEQEIARREPLRAKRRELAAEVSKLAAEAAAKAKASPADEALRQDAAESREIARAVVRSVDAAQRADDRTPLFAVRASKHDPELGSRRIRRKVSHDFRKGRKPVPGHKGGSLPLDAADLIELHGRFALQALGTETYNDALAELHNLGRLRHLDPAALAPKVDAANDGRKAA